MYKVFEKLSLEKEKKLSFLCLLLLVGSVLSHRPVVAKRPLP